MNNRTIIIVAGPTAVGKTDYAIAAARALNGEIVSADSMQLYRYMDIGSAKPTPEEREMAKHYLVDEIDPAQDFSVAEYQYRAKAAIQAIFEAGKQPIISGGTGLYVNSLIYDMDFSEMPRQQGYREKLEKEAKINGNEYLHNKLNTLDPAAASRIHPNNLKKVIRALEVCESGGSGIPEFSESFVKTKDYGVILVGLERERELLYERINLRVDLLIEAGLENEIRGLLEKGLTKENISMKGIGYKELIGYLNGEYDLPEAIRLIKRNTRHYAKRQMTWFRRYPELKWFLLSAYPSDAMAKEDFISYLSKRLNEVSDTGEMR